MIGLMLLAIQLDAQEKEVTVPFTNNSEEKELDIRVFSSDVIIKGTSRSDVLIKYRIEKPEDEDHDDDIPEKAMGLKKIGGNNFQFEISEKNNKVRIISQNWKNLIFLEIEVPKNIAININKQTGQNVQVSDIIGDINIENNVGSVTVNNVTGLVNASSSTGSIVVTFDEIPNPQNMMFNTITGDIDLTFPSTYKADLKMKSEWGDVYSDMEVETRKEEIKDSQSKTEDGKLRIISNSWTLGSLNGGGPEMTLKTQMGSIYLRKK